MLKEISVQKKHPLAFDFEEGLMAETKFLLAELIMEALQPVICLISHDLVQKRYAYTSVPSQINSEHTANPISTAGRAAQLLLVKVGLTFSLTFSLKQVWLT